MADMKNRGGQKVEEGKEPLRKEGQGVAAPSDKSVPGHAVTADGREKYRQEERNSESPNK